MTQKTHNEQLLLAHKRRLNHLKKQQAHLGISTPPHVIMEKDIEQKITKLGGTITPHKPAKVTPKVEPVTICRNAKPQLN